MNLKTLNAKTNTIYCWIFSLVGLGCNLIPALAGVQTHEEMRLLAYCSIFELTLFCAINTKIHGRLANYGTMFVLILYIFHFGQLVLFAFFIEIYSAIRILKLLDAEDVLYGFSCMHAAFSTLCLGMLMSASRLDKKNHFNKEFRINQEFDFEKVSRRVIYCTFPVKFLIDMNCLFLNLTQGSIVTRQWLNDFPNVFLYLGKVSLVGFALLLLVLRNDHKKQTKLFVLIESYILLMMLSSIRSENVGYLCVFALLYFASSDHKLPILKLVCMGVVGLLALVLIATIGEIRTADNKSINGFIELFLKFLSEKNIIFYLLDSCGDTGYTAHCVLTKWLPKFEPSYGKSYYMGIFAIIPNIPPFITFPGEITAASAFAIRLQEAGTLSEKYLNIGGSLIGEWFFNFGVFGGVVAAFFFGIWMGRTSRRFEIYKEIGNYYGLVWVLPVMLASVYWIRDYFGGQVREMVWGPLIAIAIMRTCKRKGLNSVLENNYDGREED